MTSGTSNSNVQAQSPVAPEHTELMASMSVLHLHFVVESQDTIAFGSQPGSALRGALYETLNRRFCSDPFHGQGESNPAYMAAHLAQCPVCRLMAPHDPEAARGKDIARPITIQPPLGQTTFRSGKTWRFGVTLVGQAQELCLFIIRAVAEMGRAGVGKGRSRFRLLRVEEYTPLLDASRPLLRNKTVRRPLLTVDAQAIDAARVRLSGESVTLELLTPMRLIAQGRLVKKMDPVVFLQRLLERCQSMVHYYGDAGDSTPEVWRAASDNISYLAAHLEMVDDTQWYEVQSGSRRLRRSTPISGIMGQVRLMGALKVLLPWLLWGQSLHVGKDAVKGNGWYRIAEL